MIAAPGEKPFDDDESIAVIALEDQDADAL